jgi:hypothetical protein
MLKVTAARDSEYARPIARNSPVQFAPFTGDAETLRGHPATSLRDSTMLLRKIGRHFGKLSLFRRMGAVKDVPERNRIFECCRQAAACICERRKGAERRFEVRHGANGHGSTSSTSLRRKTARKSVSPGDIARRTLGANSGATISKVLVVGTSRSEPVTRMEIHLADPERVPATFILLASALQRGGFDFNTARNCSIPATDIWLACPLNGRSKTLLSCAARIGEQQTAVVAVQSGSPRGQKDNYGFTNARQELIWDTNNWRERGKENRERTL